MLASAARLLIDRFAYFLSKYRLSRIEWLLSKIGVYRFYERMLQQQVMQGAMPEHIAVILDGNRRWARMRSLNPWIGHEYGAKKVKEFLRWCLELGVKSITLYALSTENFRRPKHELRALMNILKQKLREAAENEDIHRYQVRVKAIGRVGSLPEDVQEAVRYLEERTKHYNKRFLNIAIAYGGRAEIVDAARKIAEAVKRGKLEPEDIDEQVFESFLYTAHLPKQDPDLIIRTSGEERLSGFLLWQCAYSELYFLDVYWPDFRKIDLLRAIRTYQQRHRRFGR
ncbi:MAG TPA: di-trans,poly-cis-decaprenylcistransferase [Candidatus Bathyarchaeota archaeon]|nr:di-trans,poly-cis-decaprenylcistransferase [Candidatus Bathyarchaeota archaeon]